MTKAVRLRRRAALCIGAGILFLSLPSGIELAGAPATHEIPFEFKTHQPIVPFRINGADAVPFVVDTGASIHLIDQQIAMKASVPGGRSAQLSGGGQARVDVQFVDGLTIEAGGLAWDRQRAAVANLGYPDRKHFAGLIGAPILMRYTVQFAFPARTMRLIDPAAFTAPRGAVQIPFELQEDLPIVRVMIDAGSGPIEARLMVDTGASTFIDLNRPFVEAHRLVDIVPDAKAADRPAALGGTAPFLYGTGRRVTLGGLVFDRPRLGLSRAQSGSSSRTDRDGIIGNALLETFVVTVDYTRRTLVLERP
jgi:predicted aspartyl protease